MGKFEGLEPWIFFIRDILGIKNCCNIDLDATQLNASGPSYPRRAGGCRASSVTADAPTVLESRYLKYVNPCTFT